MLKAKLSTISEAIQGLLMLGNNKTMNITYMLFLRVVTEYIMNQTMKILDIHMGSEVFIPVNCKIMIFWEVMPCSLVKRYYYRTTSHHIIKRPQS
jgi:hypothetical protein